MRSTINRLCHACSYAAKALLEAHGHDARSHSGVKSLLNKYFVRTGTLESDLGAFYSNLMEARLDSDYDVFFEPDADQLRTWLPRAEHFIEEVVSILEEET